LKTAVSAIARETLTNIKGPAGFTPKEIAAKEEQLIKPIVQRMETKLSEPDFIIIDQYTEGQAIYLISKGECRVIVSEDSNLQGTITTISNPKKSEQGKKKEESSQLLRPGYLFGEISIVYNCLTTATVQAKKYCNLGMLTKEKYKEIVTMQPTIQDEMKRGIYEYNDKMLNFIKKSMKQIPYF